MNNELCWLVLPVAGLLSQMGGTWWKAWRRYFIPIIAFATLWIFTGNFYWGAIFMTLHLYGAFCLPITKFGDSIPDDWRNQIWLPIWGILLCSSILWLHLGYWLICITSGLLLAILVLLSNTPKLAKYFQWKFVEFFEGFLPLIPLCYFITLQP